MYLYSKGGGPSVARMACTIVVVVAAVVFLGRLSIPSSNPFAKRVLDADLLSWDAQHSSGLAMSNGATLRLRLDGSVVGGRLAAGCRVQAHGITYVEAERRVPEIVAAVLIVESCPILGQDASATHSSPSIGQVSAGNVTGR